jgi:uncharacterized protein (TIGR04255 family)
MRSKLSYSPINSAHAIVEVVMFVQFVPDFGESTIRKLVGVEHDLKDELPKVNPIQKFAFSMFPEHGSQIVQQQPIGIEMQSIGRDGSLEWMLRTTENTIAVHCLDYSRWDKVWQQAKGYLDKTFRHLEGSESFIASVGLKYIDRFLYDEEPEQASLSTLFRPDTNLVFKRAFLSGPLWHCHSGWFEDLNVRGGMKYLNQLNIDATLTNIYGNRRLVITVDHNAVAQVPQDKSSLSIVMKKNGSEGLLLDEIMGELHQRNKTMMSELLSKQMAKRINLRAKSEEK